MLRADGKRGSVKQGIGAEPKAPLHESRKSREIVTLPGDNSSSSSSAARSGAKGDGSEEP